MSRFLVVLFALVSCPALFAQTPATAEPQRQQQPQAALQTLPLMREYRGVKLGMNRDAVKAAMGKTARAATDWDEFKLGGGDLMTVRYDDKNVVKTIQLYFTNPARAPKWTEVVGDVEIREQPTGSKHARAVNKEENFWATMFQSKSCDVTTVTLSR